MVNLKQRKESWKKPEKKSKKQKNPGLFEWDGQSYGCPVKLKDFLNISEEKVK
jgi:hypothetical protein